MGVRPDDIKIGDVLKFTKGKYTQIHFQVLEIKKDYVHIMCVIQLDEYAWSIGHKYHYRIEEFREHSKDMEYVEKVPRSNFKRQLGLRYAKSKPHQRT